MFPSLHGRSDAETVFLLAFTTFLREIMYFVLHCIYRTAFGSTFQITDFHTLPVQ